MDMSNYLPIFFEESEENLQIINDNLLNLENNPKDIQAVNEIFRAAHTLKGMSATMGFQTIAEITHNIENYLDEIRKGEKELNDSILNTLFKAFDILSQALEDIRQGKNSDIDQKILDELFNNKNEQQMTIQGDTTTKIVKDYEQYVISNALAQGFNVYHLKIELNKDCLLKAARAFMVYKQLEELGEIIKTSPRVEDIEEERFDNSFEIWLISKTGKGELEKIKEIPEVGRVEILAIDDNSIEIKTKGEKEEQLNIKPLEGNGQGNNFKNQTTIRVDINRLDALMNLVSELVINKTGLNQSVSTNNQSLALEGLEQLHRITTELQNVVMSLRMVPIDRVFSRFPRMVRDTAKDLGKEVELTIIGKETELDRTIIDEIGDPLVHLIRNAIDHGLEDKEERKRLGKPEKGKIELKAYQSGNEVFVEVSDDGKGIDYKKIGQTAVNKGIISEHQLTTLDPHNILQLIFEPGFSTKEVVTDLSGRGVGLDVVKTSIEALGGGIEIQTEIGKGTKFIIHLPLTLAIIQGLLVKVGEEKYAIPLASIVETAAFDAKVVKKVGNQKVLMFRNSVLPLVDLADVLECTRKETSNLSMVVVKKGEKQIGLIVDDLIGQQEIVIKHLGDFLSNIKGFAGATISGDGEVILILDTNSLFFN
ncbi:two-component system, chemotaxis family, sensor kinase CheA [Anaerobranca californiensis DSM 14826]|jgi:two-component system chemotaxis sensor kinase CheA|uniref:Chemotaxis protein CheA n=1 Tax=Anaerobranca californiensis DSM 14826 TaxID=1120989 RepID=A0A1M6KH76_9FIRM|nr:chemotaxis protein CheA [Anaerobranca californiensis]SHJ58288.1 two-component system, chemotaxis family, sensor kinase CheA [Anaerobranca californiensis DSM 14826]